MALLNELMSLTLSLITKPFALWKESIAFSLRILLIFVHTWIDLVKGTIRFHLRMIWGSMIFIAAVVTLPVQIITALQREKLLEGHLQEMQLQLEGLVWDRKELGDRLQKTVKERRIIESMFAELEDEHDKAMAKIELLETELQDVKDETRQLRSICNKGRWSFMSPANTTNAKNNQSGALSWKSSNKEKANIFQDLKVPTNTWDETKSNNNAEFLNFLKTNFASSNISPDMFTTNPETDQDLDHRRVVAVLQSFFSAFLSLLVGMIIWQAEDPCMPLVMALFTVVGMSLKSVVEFFSTIRNKPASDAVALLSFNWFLLGMLTYPTLPRVARMLSPLALQFVNHTMS